jgi:hypothetical protein
MFFWNNFLIKCNIKNQAHKKDGIIEIGNGFHNSMVYVADIKWWADSIHK